MIKIDTSKLDYKKIMTIASVLIVIVIVYFLIRKAIKSAKADKYEKKVSDEINSVELSYPLNQYVALADELHDAMAYLGTKDKKVMAVFTKMNNLSDMLQLIKAFGTRNYYPFWGPKTLPQWIVAEMTTGEIAEINAILKQRSINFSF